MNRKEKVLGFFIWEDFYHTVWVSNAAEFPKQVTLEEEYMELFVEPYRRVKCNLMNID